MSLTAEGLTYRTPEGHLVLDGVRFTVGPGEVVDITGPSGSGKSTLLRALARLLPGAEGRMWLGDVSADDIVPTVWRTRVAMVPQTTAIVPGTVRDNLLLPWTLKVREGVGHPDDGALVSALTSVGLGDVTLARDAARLSVGQASRIALLRVTLTEPEVLLLDEPDASLDDESAAQVAAATTAAALRDIAIVRVRHRGADSVVARRLRLAAGRLSEVTA